MTEVTQELALVLAYIRKVFQDDLFLTTGLMSHDNGEHTFIAAHSNGRRIQVIVREFAEIGESEIDALGKDAILGRLGVN